MADRAFSGVRCEIQIDDKEVGWGTEIEGITRTRLARADALGDAYSKDIEVTGSESECSFAEVFIIGKSLAARGIYPQGDTATLVNFPAATILVFDNVGDQPIWKAYGFKFEEHRFRVTREGLMAVNVRGQCKKIVDTAGTP